MRTSRREDGKNLIVRASEKGPSLSPECLLDGLAHPQILPLTVTGAHGRNEPAELAAPAALTQKWPALSSLQGAPADNVGRTYAAFAADIDNETHTVPDFADAGRRHEVIAAIERSAASGERVKA